MSDESAELEGDRIDVGEMAIDGWLEELLRTGLVAVVVGSLLRNWKRWLLRKPCVDTILSFRGKESWCA